MLHVAHFDHRARPRAAAADAAFVAELANHIGAPVRIGRADCGTEERGRRAQRALRIPASRRARPRRDRYRDRSHARRSGRDRAPSSHARRGPRGSRGHATRTRRHRPSAPHARPHGHGRGVRRRGDHAERRSDEPFAAVRAQPHPAPRPAGAREAQPRDHQRDRTPRGAAAAVADISADHAAAMLDVATEADSGRTRLTTPTRSRSSAFRAAATPGRTRSSSGGSAARATSLARATAPR